MTEPRVKRYKQKFRNSWFENESIGSWLAASDEPDTAYCKVCNCTLKAKFSLLKSHKATKKHIKRMAGFISFIQNQVDNAKEGVMKKDSIEEIFLEDNSRVVRGDDKERIKSFQSSVHSNDEMEKIDDNSIQDDQCSSPLRLSDSEYHDQIIEIVSNSGSEKDVDPQNYKSKSFTSKSRTPKERFRSFDSTPRKRYDKYPEEYWESDSLRWESDDNTVEHEVVAFAKSIAAQMRNLPEERIAKLSSDIQRLVTIARIEYLEEQKAQNVDTPTPVINFSIKTEGVNKAAVESNGFTTFNNTQS